MPYSLISSLKRLANARVLAVAPHLDLVVPSLAQQSLGRGSTIADRSVMIGASGGGTPPQAGLPLAISVPPELRLLPGEVVDLRLLAHSLAREDTPATPAR